MIIFLPKCKQTYMCYYKEVQARQAMLTFVLQQADNNVIAADSRVEPVVITSSINKICFDTKLSTSITAKMSLVFSQRLYIIFFVCVVVSTLRIKAWVFNSLPIAFATPFAISSFLFYPLFLYFF